MIFGRGGCVADAGKLKVFGAGAPVSPVKSFSAWGSPSERKLPTPLPQFAVTVHTGFLGLDWLIDSLSAG